MPLTLRMHHTHPMRRTPHTRHILPTRRVAGSKARAPAGADQQHDGSAPVTLPVDLRVYTLNALLRACYLFTDRCYVFLRRTAEHEVAVDFRSSGPDGDMDDIVGLFGNELLNQRLRADIARETKDIRDRIVAQAFAEADLGNSGT